MRAHIFLLLVLWLFSLTLLGCNDTSNPGVIAVVTDSQSVESQDISPTKVPAKIEPEVETPGNTDQGVEAGVYEDIPVGFTEEGFPYRGDPAAPITLEEFSDYLCPFCGRHFNETLPTLLEQYISQGQVKYVFRDMPLVSLHPSAPAGHKAARCVGEQSAVGYWQMHDALFRTQAQWGSVPDPVSYVSELATSSGVDMDAFQACMVSSELEAQINESVAAGAELGFNGTPSFRFILNEDGETYTLIGAYPIATFTGWIDALLAGEAPPEEAQPEEETPELPFWANEEGLAPDPDRLGYTLAGDQYKGDPQAEVVVVEFSDFQCPACQAHTLEVQPVLDQEFVETGEVLWVFKHLPLRMHPQALVAATAAECAADQGAFWEMHDLLFESVDKWAVEEPEAALVTLAEDINLNLEEFSACLYSREPLERVIADMYDSQGVVSSTPNFVVLKGGRGTLLQSSRPADQFVTILQGVLDSTSGEESGG